MVILIYYKDIDSVSDLKTHFELKGDTVKLRLIDNFNEHASDNADEAILSSDIPEGVAEAIAQYLVKAGIKFSVVDVESLNTISDNNETTDFESLEEAEAYRAELLQEIEAIDKVIAEFKSYSEKKQERLEQEAAEAKELAEKEADEAKEDGDNPEETDPLATGEKFEYPTRENMIMALRELKESEGIEVKIPHNPTLAKLQPLYDQYIRKINEDS